MLVLSRKIGERIRIGDDIAVVVLDVRGNRIKLGIEAPADVPVHRQELWQHLREDRNAERPLRHASRRHRHAMAS